MIVTSPGLQVSKPGLPVTLGPSQLLMPGRDTCTQVGFIKIA